MENIAKGAAVSGQMQFRVAIIGAGALGTFFACRLRQAGCPVTLIARGARLRTLQVDGLRFSDARGAVRQPCAFSDNASAAAQAALAILAVKSWQLDGALADLAQAACNPIDDKRGTVGFRTHVAGVLARRVARIAYDRARENQ